jgi:glycosyltransferase involved in cell wall biosynthesis
MISCIIPACNESGQLKELIFQINKIQKISEIFIVEGGSKDNTWEVATEMQEKFPKKIHALKQTGKGKFNAVLEGAAAANERFIMIWDADATVSLESSLALIDIVGSEDEFIMGDRLKGTNQRKSFRLLNKIGNYFFSILWSPILNFKLMDLFCGTKIFPKSLILKLDQKLGSIDNYGDLTLIFAAKTSAMKIKSEPVQYLARAYGTSNMMRWSTARKFLHVTFFAYKENFKVKL